MDTERWLGVELRHLAALQAIATCGSFRTAAATLGYTQSTVSQQIATLERLVGERLVNRGRGQRPMSLTDAGNVLLSHAEAIMTRIHAAKADFSTLSRGGRAVLRIGVYQSVGARLLPHMLQQVVASGYQGTFRLTTRQRDEDLLDLLQRDQLDLTFTIFPFPTGPFDGVRLMRDPFVLLLRPDSPLAVPSRRVTLADIGELPLVGHQPCRSGNQAEFQLRAAGIEPNIVLRADDQESVVGLVAEGIGASIVPRLTVPHDPQGVVVRELGALMPPRILGLIWHHDRYHPPAQRAFIEIARDTCAKHEEAERNASLKASA